MLNNRSISIISLGCSKNLVDSEHLALQLSVGGWNVSIDDSPNSTDVAIVNTCGFIADASEESVDTILELVELKKRGDVGRIIVVGCLSQRYMKDLIAGLPEVDLFFGVDELQNILKKLNTRFCTDRNHERLVSTPSHYAYLKISEGCNRKCTFCIIPSIRGRHKSTPVDMLVREAEYLSSRGVKELILVAQDLSSYGNDLKQPASLKDLLTKLEAVAGTEWIRLHYAYPAGFPLDVLPLLARSDKILPYLDIPFQHASDPILKAMKRGHSAAESRRLIKRIRKEVPGIAIRTTLITGFPGETEEDFRALLNFVKEIEFDRLGVFRYSEEEGTMAARLNDNIPDEVKEERAAILMDIQDEISLNKNSSLIGSVMEVIIDSSDEENAIGRTWFDSPEVDQEVIVTNGEHLKPGEIINIIIRDAAPHELTGEPE